MATVIAGYLIDVTLSEEHTLDSEVTSHPVESGSDVTDNIRARPVQIRLECVVSNTPLTAPVLDGEGATVADTVYGRLLRIRTDKQPVTVATSRGSFDNMLMQSLSLPADSKTGHAIEFTVTFVQVSFVSNELTVLTAARAKSKRNHGHRPSKTPDKDAGPINYRGAYGRSWKGESPVELGNNNFKFSEDTTSFVPPPRSTVRDMQAVDVAQSSKRDPDQFTSLNPGSIKII